MYLVISKWVIAVKVSNFFGQYLRNHWTLDIGVLGYIGIVWPKEHSPEDWSVPPVTPCMSVSYAHCVCFLTAITVRNHTGGLDFKMETLALNREIWTQFWDTCISWLPCRRRSFAVILSWRPVFEIWRWYWHLSEYFSFRLSFSSCHCSIFIFIFIIIFLGYLTS